MSEPARSAPWRGWQTSCLVGILVLTAWTACFRFPIVWQWLGIGEGDKPFLDLYGLLASGEQAQAGHDSFQPNPLDPYHRPNVYISWWLVTGRLGLTRADTPWLGVALLLATLVTALGLLKPKNWREAAGVTGVLLSPALLMAVSRANNDLVIFLVVSGALLALRRGGAAWRGLAVALLAVAAALKYYPLAGAIVLVHARHRRELLGGVAIYVGVLLLAAPALGDALASAGRYKPRPEWLYAFGAPMFWRNFHLENALLWLVPGVLVIAWTAYRAWAERDDADARSSTSAEKREFLVGSALVVGCFFLGASYVYKLVFALWLLPWLRRGTYPTRYERRAQLTRRLLYAVLWFEGLGALALNLVIEPVFPTLTLRVLYAVLSLQQILTWGLVGCLLWWIFAAVFPRLRRLVPPGAPPVASSA